MRLCVHRPDNGRIRKVYFVAYRFEFGVYRDHTMQVTVVAVNDKRA